MAKNGADPKAMRKVYLLPNIVTTANMACGFYSVIACLQGDLIGAAWAIVIAGIFDGLDGRIARMAKATSQFGVEYDSLSDLASFGFAPAVLMYEWALHPYGRFGWLAAFLFMACGGLRLARFNVTTSSLPKGFFQGLPIPMAAGTVATFIIFSETLGLISTDPSEALNIHTMTLFMSLTLATLMVSTLPFPSFKEVSWRSRASFGFLMVGVLSMILIAVKPEVSIFALLATYISTSLLWNAFRKFRGVPLPGVSKVRV
jgi:CDP-diacylglycerol--serine O-phosphatidyltransferase